MKTEISTDFVDARQRLPFWADCVCEHLVAVECDGVPDPATFSARLSVVSVPGIDIARIESGAQVVRRTPRLIATAGADAVLVNIQRSGTSAVTRGGCSAILHTGDLAVYDGGHPYELVFDQAFSQTVLILDRGMLSTTFDAGPVAVTRIAASSEFAKLLACLSDAIGSSVECLPQSTAPLSLALRQTVDAMLRPHRCAEEIRDSRHYHLARIKAHIAANLNDPCLSAATIAAALHLSPSHVHRVFELERESIGGWIQEQRLRACKMEFDEGADQPRAISEVALRHGFTDMSHFSRVFRKRYGRSPRDCRLESAARALTQGPGSPRI